MVLRLLSSGKFHGIRTALLWIPPFLFLLSLFAPEPLTSRAEDRVLLLLLLLGAAMQFLWKRCGAKDWMALYAPALTVFLFTIASRALSMEEIARIGWIATLWLAAAYLLAPRLESERQVESGWTRLVPRALLLGTGLLLTFDLMLVMIQPSAIPIAIPEFWLERIGFLWPLLAIGLGGYRLSAAQGSRRCALLALLILSGAVLAKEQGWNRKMQDRLAEAEAAARQGQVDEARQALAEVREWNGRKRMDKVAPVLRRLRARLALEQGQVLAAFYEIKQCIETHPQQAPSLLTLAGSEEMGEVARLPLSPLTDLRLMVDLEPGSEEGEFFLLDRWGRVFRRTDFGWKPAFEDPPRAMTEEEPADLEILKGGRGAVAMSKRGRFYFHGETPESLRSLLSSSKIPAQTYVDFELTPSQKGVYLLSDRGPVIGIGEIDVELSPGDQIQWPYSIARDLELSPDGLGLYLMDGLGKVHPFGQTAVETEGKRQPYWAEERAADIEWLPSGDGFYLLTNYGGIYVVGSDEVRKAYRIPDSILPIRTWPYAIAFQVSADGEEIVILECNGGLTRIQRKVSDPRAWLTRIGQLLERGEWAEAVNTVDRFLELAPEHRAAALDLLDATFCRNLASAPIRPEDPARAAQSDKPREEFCVAVDVEQTGEPETDLILDRWGRIWLHDGTDYRLLKSVSLFGPDSGPATDLEWIASASAGLVLYDNGQIEPWGPVPDRWLTLLKDYQPEGKGWIDLEPGGNGECLILANAYGGFRTLGDSALLLPGAGEFTWGDVRLGRDLVIGPVSGAAYFVDAYGGLHPFGDNRLFTRGEKLPYWSKDRARACILDGSESGGWILDRFGTCFPLNPRENRFHAGIAAFDPRDGFSDLELAVDGSWMTLLEGNFHVTTLFIAEHRIDSAIARLTRLMDSGRETEALAELDETLSFFPEPEAQRRLLQALPPERILALRDRFLDFYLPADSRVLLKSYFENAPGLFTAFRISPRSESASLMDRFGRLYRCVAEFPSDRPVFESTDLRCLPSLDTARAMDFEWIASKDGDAYLILDSEGNVWLRGSFHDRGLDRLMEAIGLDPLPGALKLALTADLQGAVVMNREGYLKAYGQTPIPRAELGRLGWANYAIARDLHLTLDDRGLYLLDGLGSVHAIGETAIPTRPGELDSFPWFGKDLARAMSPPLGKGFWIADRFGRLHDWAKAPFRVPPEAALTPRLAAGETIQAVQSKDANRAFLMTDWGRVQILKGGVDGARWHREQLNRTEEPVQLLRHLYQSMASDPDHALDTLCVIDPDWFFRLSDLLDGLSEDFWQSLKEQPEIHGMFRVFTDIRPGPESTQVYVLDRWGRIFLYDVDRQEVLRAVHPDSIRDPVRKKAAAFGLWEYPPGSSPAFLIADTTGAMWTKGSLSDALLEGVRRAGLDFYETVDLAIARDGQSVFLLDSTGRVRFAGLSPMAPASLPEPIWKFSIARSLALDPSGRGFYLLDGHGVVHPFGQTEIPVKNAESIWFPKDEARALRLDDSGKGLYLLHASGRVHSVGFPEPVFPNSRQPAARPGEEWIRLEWDAAFSQFWMLSSRGRIVRIPAGRRGAEQCARAAMERLQEDRLFDSLQFIGVALEVAPGNAPELLKSYSPRLVSRLLDVPDWQCGEIDLWTDLEVNAFGDRAWLLNRWGEIFEATGDFRSLARLKENTRNVAAVDSLWNASASMALILYEDGFVESWGNSVDSALAPAIEAYNASPVPNAADLEWTAEEKGFYVTSNRGQVTAVGEVAFDLDLARAWHWDEAMAGALKASPDGKALFLFDRLGGIHALGRGAVALADRNAPYFKKPGMAVDIEWAPGGQGFVFLDAFGGVHSIGRVGSLPERGSLPYFDTPCLADLEVTRNGDLFLLSRNGRVYRSRME